MFRSFAILELAVCLSVPAQRVSSPPGPHSAFVLNFCCANLDQAKRLVESGSDLDARDAAGSTPLLIAVFSGSFAATSYLIAHGAKVNIPQGQTESTALQYAILSGRSDLVKVLLAGGAEVNRRYARKATALHLAAARPGKAVVRMLLGSGAEVNAIDEHGDTPLDVAVLHGRTDAVSILLQAGADPTRVHPLDRRGPMHEACIKGYGAIIPLLAEAGADLAALDGSGQAPVDLALDYKNSGAVRALLQLASRYRKVEATFERAMELATSRDHIEVIRMLSDCGWDVNRPSPDGSSYLSMAALRGHARSVRQLLECGVRVDTRNQLGGTPLHDAALGGSTEVIALLLDSGAPINARDQDSGATPLMLAASLGRAEAVTLLLKRGADPALRDKAGKTAIDRAQASHDPALIKLLEKAPV